MNGNRIYINIIHPMYYVYMWFLKLLLQDKRLLSPVSIFINLMIWFLFTSFHWNTACSLYNFKIMKPLWLFKGIMNTNCLIWTLMELLSVNKEAISNMSGICPGERKILCMWWAIRDCSNMFTIQEWIRYKVGF